MKSTTTFNSWVTSPQPNPDATMRLFCFTYAGGNATTFRTWHHNLPNNIEVCPIEIPGRGRQIKAIPHQKIAPLLTEITDHIIPFLDKPFLIFGYSMGSLISFELCRLLRSQYNLSPLHLLVAARRAPQFPPEKPLISHLPNDQFIVELSKFNGTPQVILDNPELMEIFLPVIRADFTLLESYNYTEKAPFDFPITAFGGLQDPEVSHNALQAWEVQTNASFCLKMLPGDHFFINSAKKPLLQYISQIILALPD
ncbi:thioesterase [Anabaena sp. FACHB-1237]|uniref:thioesterase II family protein n=1 Tax=Anabaena sp. FACHB-1237 TaxID=2692769 RepID=UPI00168050C2|nr:thioesterase [Anabaena sp. FACHB-1237]MBD2136114.1 thioesterase [Anabaena sp. FACHB-1237]